MVDTKIRKVNVGVLGCDSWGKNHARVFAELSDANLLAVGDIDEVRARVVGERFGVDWYQDILKIIERKDVELVSVCTPTVTHAEIALRAIEAGKHVLVEKPMTNTVGEAKELIYAAKRHGVHLAVGFVERFNPAVTKAKEIINSGKIGEIVLATSQRVSRRPERIGDVGGTWRYTTLM